MQLANQYLAQIQLLAGEELTLEDPGARLEAKCKLLAHYE
jgi:hypothetical protein